jgi:hypothetical protein
MVRKNVFIVKISLPKDYTVEYDENLRRLRLIKNSRRCVISIDDLSIVFNNLRSTRLVSRVLNELNNLPPKEFIPLTEFMKH